MTPQVESLKSSLLRFLLLDVLPYHGFVSTRGRDEVPPWPQVLTYEIRFFLRIPGGTSSRVLGGLTIRSFVGGPRKCQTVAAPRQIPGELLFWLKTR